MNELVAAAKRRIERRELEWEDEHKEDIKQTALYIIDPDMVHEAMGECSDEVLMKAKQYAIEGNDLQFGALLRPTVEAYILQLACDDLRRRQDIDACADAEIEIMPEHETLTRAQRTPDLLK